LYLGQAISTYLNPFAINNLHDPSRRPPPRFQPPKATAGRPISDHKVFHTNTLEFLDPFFTRNLKSPIQNPKSEILYARTSYSIAWVIVGAVK